MLVAGLTRSGFLTVERRLRNWYDYAGRLIEKREANAALAFVVNYASPWVDRYGISKE